MHALKFIIGFVLLNLYLRLVPTLFNGSEVLWLATFLLFFPLAHFIGRWSSGAGLNKQGLDRESGWERWLLAGAVVGGSVWILLAVAELVLGSLRFTGWQPIGAALWVAVQALVVAVLGSATNDVMTRGYVVAHWKDRLPASVVVLLSTTLYVADDIWLEGWNLRNNLFSFMLGLAFALSVLRTRSLWMNIGMHAGLNLVYYLVYGFERGSTNYGVFRTVSKQIALSPYLGIFGAVVVLTLALLLTRRGRETNKNYSYDHTQTRYDRRIYRQLPKRGAKHP
jgi:membrane protease YdiL (CAAX protease family)